MPLDPIVKGFLDQMKALGGPTLAQAGPVAGREQFVALRGETSKPPSVLGFPSQHFNAITSWAVDAKGEVKHVYA